MFVVKRGDHALGTESVDPRRSEWRNHLSLPPAHPPVFPLPSLPFPIDLPCLQADDDCHAGLPRVDLDEERDRPGDGSAPHGLPQDRFEARLLVERVSTVVAACNAGTETQSSCYHLGTAYFVPRLGFLFLSRRNQPHLDYTGFSAEVFIQALK